MKDNNNRIEEVMSVAMENMRSLIDVDIVVGKPIVTTSQLVILPLTKVTMGFVSGGGEYYSELKEIKKETLYPFSGGSGAGVSLQPVAFLVIDGKDANLIKIDQKTAVEKLIETAPEIAKFISKIITSENKNEKNN